MIPRPLLRPQFRLCWRGFATTSASLSAKNRMYTVVRNPDELYNYISLSASSRTPFVTLWTTSWCSTCRIVSPILKDLITSGVGEPEGGVSYAEVELDAADIMKANFGLTYIITKIPTLLSFTASEPHQGTKVVDGKLLTNRQFLKQWIENEARRGGDDGEGGIFGAVVGGFGILK